MTKVHQIRQEFDESFKDVVFWFAKTGYSKRATAQILGINRDWFRTLISRHAPDAPWKPVKERRDDCKPRNKKHKYSDEYLLSLLREFPGLSIRKFNRVSPVSADIYFDRFSGYTFAKQLAEMKG